MFTDSARNKDFTIFIQYILNFNTKNIIPKISIFKKVSISYYCTCNS